ncbi:solute carrier family 35 member F5-like [Rhopilema esculentum]|uniref:solute carrier family 35 member F5-like n=1 Tax=Rhopilema esculentum TaxID=499914 RepID=UPI0031E287C8
MGCTCCRKLFASVRNRRFLLGVFVLSLVVVLWVGSSELTKYIFGNLDFDKPFFTTYTKTILFMFYFIGFLFYKPWQLQCGLCIMQTAPLHVRKQKHFGREDLNESSKINPTIGSLNGSNYSSRSASPIPNQFLTDPTFENMTDDDMSLTGSEMDIADQARRHVRFNRTREIRHLTEKDSHAAMLARLSYSSIEDLEEVLNTINSRVPFSDTIRLAFVFCVLWMCGSFFYQAALAHTSAAATNILSSTSGFFTLILSSIFQSSVMDKFSLSKLVAVAASIGGITLVSLSDPSNHGSINEGAIFALLSALCYALYLVLLTRKVGKEKTLDIPLFFAFVGLFAALIFWPAFFILHHTGVEKFEMPPNNQTWLFIVVNGIFGTILAELLWLWGCLLTSSVIGTLALGLVTPLTMLWDILFNKMKFSWMFLGGTIPVFLSFIVVTILGHYGDWDPVMDALKACCRVFRRCEKEESVRENEEQSESLIENEAGSFGEVEIKQS